MSNEICQLLSSESGRANLLLATPELDRSSTTSTAMKHDPTILDSGALHDRLSRTPKSHATEFPSNLEDWEPFGDDPAASGSLTTITNARGGAGAGFTRIRQK